MVRNPVQAALQSNKRLKANFKKIKYFWLGMSIYYTFIIFVKKETRLMMLFEF